MAAPTACFARWLQAVDNRNASGEYYLTDVIALARNEGVAIETSRAASVIETLGVNTMRELAQLERLYQRAQADALLDAGVTLADPGRIDIRGALACGADVAIDVGCVFEGTVRLADGVAIGANCVLKNVTVDAGSQVLPVLAPRGRDDRRELPGRPVCAAAAGRGARRRRPHRQFRRGEGEHRSGAARRPTTSPTSATRRWAPA